MTGLDRLRTVEESLRPLMLVGDIQRVGSEVLEWSAAGLTVRVVRGRKMRILAGVFDEFAAALQFPLYFGENEAALDECLADLENLSPGGGFVLVLVEPEEVLADDESVAFERLTDILGTAAEEWSRPIELGEWWDRPAVPFHVVLAGLAEAVAEGARRWSACGIEPVPLAES